MTSSVITYSWILTFKRALLLSNSNSHRLLAGIMKMIKLNLLLEISESARFSLMKKMSCVREIEAPISANPQRCYN